MAPFCGYIPKILAGVVDTISTQRSLVSLAVDDRLVHQVDPLLDAREAVGDLAEVAAAHLLLAVEVERAVVGADELEVVALEGVPELVRSGPASRSGGEHTNLAPSNPWPRSSSVRYRYCGQVSAQAIAPRSRAAHERLERLLGRHVDEVDRSARRPRPAG